MQTPFTYEDKLAKFNDLVLMLDNLQRFNLITDLERPLALDVIHDISIGWDDYDEKVANSYLKNSLFFAKACSYGLAKLLAENPDVEEDTSQINEVSNEYAYNVIEPYFKKLVTKHEESLMKGVFG